MREAEIRPEVAAALTARGYALGPEVDRGGTAIVYRARDTRQQRDVAIKVLRADVSDHRALERFEREIALAAGLAHPHILPVYDSGIAEGQPYYVTPLIEETTLRTRLREGPLPLGQAMQIAIDIAEAMAYAHGHGVIHRDLKPENILLSQGHAIVADFGIARAIAPQASTTFRSVPAASESAERLTAANVVVGTPHYMSPEQASGDEVDERTDIYSLGCLCYEMLTGRPPFEGSSARELVARRFQVTPEAIAGELRDYPPPLGALIARCLQVDPSGRPRSAQAVAEALRGISTGQTTAVSAPAPGERPGRSTWRGRAAIAVGVVAILIGLVWWAVRPEGLDPRRVVVTPFADETGEVALAPVAALAIDRIKLRLAAVRGIEVVTSATVVRAFRFPWHQGHPQADTARADPLQALRDLAEEARAGTLITGSFYLEADTLEFEIELTDARNGVLLRALGPFRAPLPAREALVDRMAAAVAAAVDSLAGRP